MTGAVRSLPVAGSTIGDGRFWLLGKLGEGGMAGVYLAQDRVLGRELALKLLLPRYVGRPEREQRLVDEAAYLTKMRGHPHIIEIVDSGRLSDGGWPWLSTEFLLGQSLDVLLVRDKLEVARVIDIAAQVAGALAACHARGVVHRDATPANVFVLDGDAIKLFDFSHAGTVAGPRVAAGAAGRLTGPHDAPGTIGYMAPEQAARAPADPAMDVFGIGVLLFEMITRRNPFSQFSEREAFILAQRSGQAQMPQLHAWAYDVPEELAAIVGDCTRADASERPTMAEVYRRLCTLGGRAVGPPLATTTTKAGWRVALAGAAVLAVLGGGWVASRSGESESAASFVQQAELSSEIEPPQTEPEPEPIPTSVPLPTLEPAPELTPMPRSEPTVSRPPLTTEPRCNGVEDRGRAAFERRDWRTVLAETSRKTCWRAHEQDRVRLRTTALFNLGRWTECAKIGETSNDPKIRSIAAACLATAIDQPEPT